MNRQVHRCCTILLTCSAMLLVAGCNGIGGTDQTKMPGYQKSFGHPDGNAPPGSNDTVAAGQPDPERGQDEILDAQKNQARKAEVTVDARVVHLLPDDTVGLPHQRFLLQLRNGTTVLVAHDTKLAPRVPLSEGAVVRIHGEYIWNGRGGILHWTHRSPNGRHEDGWIQYDGQRYQ